VGDQTFKCKKETVVMETSIQTFVIQLNANAEEDNYSWSVMDEEFATLEEAIFWIENKNTTGS
jgi:hypothetical protein